MSLVFAALLAWTFTCLTIIAPIPPAPSRAGSSFLLAVLLTLPVCFVEAYFHIWPETMSVPILAAILLILLLAFWRLLRRLEPQRLSDLRPAARRDGLSTRVSLQLNIAAAVLVTALVVGAELVVAGPPAWRLTKLSANPNSFLPTYGLLAATLLLLIGVEIVRVRTGTAVTGEPKPLPRAFGTCFGNWTSIAFTGMIVALVTPAGGI